MQARVVVFAAGAEAVPLSDDDVVIAADGGALAAPRIDLLIGDFDSLPAGTTAGLLERHPEEKDASDLELALDAAIRFEPRRVLVVGGAAGRLDHLLGVLLLLGSDRYAGTEIDARLGAASVHVVRGRRVLRGSPGETISLFAVQGPADGVRTRGLVYPLDGETLQPGSSRGLSNEFAAVEASVELAAGVLLAVRPDSDPEETASSSPGSR
jgi:thiamine pyrophosphokinase